MLLISKNFVFPILRRKKNFAPENGGVGEGWRPPALPPPPPPPTVSTALLY